MTTSTDTSPASTPAITQEFWISKHADGIDQHIEPATPAGDDSELEIDPLKAPVDKSDQPKDNALATNSHITRLLHVDYITRIESRLSNTGSIALVFTSYDAHDHIRVHTLDGHLAVDINEHRYHLPDFLNTETLVLRSGGGNDQIDIDLSVSNPVIIESGTGADAVQTGAGPARVYSGPGNDAPAAAPATSKPVMATITSRPTAPPVFMAAKAMTISSALPKTALSAAVQATTRLSAAMLATTSSVAARVRT